MDTYPASGMTTVATGLGVPVSVASEPRTDGVLEPLMDS
jgi:hypothetical protein